MRGKPRPYGRETRQKKFFMSKKYRQGHGFHRAFRTLGRLKETRRVAAMWIKCFTFEWMRSMWFVYE